MIAIIDFDWVVSCNLHDLLIIQSYLWRHGNVQDIFEKIVSKFNYIRFYNFTKP